MNHKKAFIMQLQTLERKVLTQDEQERLDAHMKTCQDCRLSFRLYDELIDGADKKWPPPVATNRQFSRIMNAVQNDRRRESMRRGAIAPFRYALWAVLAVAMVAGLSWIFSNVRPDFSAVESPFASDPAQGVPQQGGIPQSEEAALPAPIEIEKTPVQPLLSGEYIQGLGWSPQGSYFAFSMVEKSDDPRSDREFAVIKIFNPGTGEICRTDLRYLGGTRVNTREMVAWLPDEGLLAVTPDLTLAILSPCEPGYAEVGSGLIKLAVNIPFSTGSSNWILVRGESSFWLFDSINHSLHRLEAVPANLQIRHLPGWSPSGERLALVNPAETAMDLYIFDAATGEVERVIPLDIPPDNYPPMVEWVLEDRVFIWDHSEAGPLLVSLLLESVKYTRVIPEYLGLHELNYPNEINGMGVYSDVDTSRFFIVLHLDDGDKHRLYIYDSGLEGTRDLAYEGNIILFEPKKSRVLPIQDYAPISDQEAYDLLWLTDPGLEPEPLIIKGHWPDNRPWLDVNLMPGGGELLISSSQGVSRVALPGGEVLGFWELVGAENASHAGAQVSESGEVIVIAFIFSEGVPGNQSALYYLPIR
jgi:hypothetical protein